MKYVPHEYQERAKQFAVDRILEGDVGAGLMLDMGLGKTAITLDAINDLIYDHFAVRRVLILAPYHVAVNTWPAEIKKWDNFSHLSYCLCTGDMPAARVRTRKGEKYKVPGPRPDALNKDTDIVIANRENFPWIVSQYKPSTWPFDLVVWDESSALKNHKSLRFKLMKKLRPRLTGLIELTGTPASKGLVDLWAQVRLLDDGKALGQRYGAFLDQYFEPDQRNRTTIFSWKIRDEKSKLDIYEAIRPCCISMQSETYLQLPAITYSDYLVKLTPTDKARYDTFEKEAVLEVDAEVLTAANAAVLTGKLLQMSSGAVYNEDKEVVQVHTAKLDALAELIEQANSQPVIVAYWYQHERDRLLAKYPKAATIDTPNVIEKWSKGEIDILLLHPTSGGYGLNLQAGGHILIWYTLPQGYTEAYVQLIGRLLRQGQKYPVSVWHLVCAGTHDEKVLSVLHERERGEQALLRAIRAVL